MKVQIIEGHAWYRNKEGEIFSVMPYAKDDNYWRLSEQEQPHITKLIKKDLCEVVEE